MVDFSHYLLNIANDYFHVPPKLFQELDLNSELNDILTRTGKQSADIWNGFIFAQKKC